MSTELPGLSAMNLKMDMVHFQDETLKNIRQMQSKLDNKVSKSEEYINENITKFDLKIKSLEEKIIKLSNSIIEDNLMKEKLESLFKFKEETQDIIFKRRAKYAELEKKLDNNINEINKILIKTVIYPTVIGKTAKFQTFHEFIDYTIQEISQLNIFKNKSEMDSMTSFKKKINEIIEAFKIQINNLTPKEITNQLINDLEERMNSNFKLYDERLKDTRVENNNYSINIQKRVEEINTQINNLMKTQNYMNKKLEKIQKFEFLNLLSNEIIEINEKINKAFNILKDLSSFHPEVKSNYRNEFEQKLSKKIISGVKEYIKGFIDADELSSMKKFAYRKSKTKMIDLSSNQKIQQKISPENSFNNYFSLKKQNNFYDSKNNSSEEGINNNVNKKFLKKKSVNILLQENLINSKETEPSKLIKKTLIRKNTVSFKNDANFEYPRINAYIVKSNNNNFLNKSPVKISNLIIEEEDNDVNNNSNLSDSRYISSNKNKIDKPLINNNIVLKDQIDIYNNKNIDIKKDGDKNIINLDKHKSNIKGQKEKREIKSYIITESQFFSNKIKNKGISSSKRDSIIKEILNDEKSISKINKLNSKDNNNYQGSKSERNNNSNSHSQIAKTNQIVQSDKNISPIKTKLYKMYSNFPKINNDNNNISIPTKSESYHKKINMDNFYKNKFLMLNPNYSPLNELDKTFKNMFKINLKMNMKKNVRLAKNKNSDINNLINFEKKDKIDDNK